MRLILLGLPGAHEAVVDENRLELGPEGPVGQDRAGGAVDAPRKSRDGHTRADGLFDLVELDLDELLSVHRSPSSAGQSYFNSKEGVKQNPTQNLTEISAVGLTPS